MVRADPIIAVVDDEASVRTMLGRLLRTADYQVSPFASGEDFLASLAAQRPACAILDIHMSGMSGFDVQSHMRAAHLGIPVVFITASDDVALEGSAHELQAICLLRKPFSGTALLDAVDIALDRRAGEA
jgi:FixJ family two-component response regulator